MISHRYRCIYVKVPKCASTAVADWFIAHCRARRSFRPGWYGGLLSHRIQNVTRVMNLYPDYFTFSFVRNPYQRFVSIWLYLNRRAQRATAGGYDHPAGYGSLPEFAELCHDVLGDFAGRWGPAARDFFRDNVDRAYGPGRIKLRHLGFVTGHARPQVDYLPDCNPRRLFGVPRRSGEPLAFLGAVETIEADFRRLRDLLGLPAGELAARNASGAGAGAERAGSYAACYDRATRRLVEELYAADLDFTGCGFDDGRRSIAVPARPAPAQPASAARRRRAGPWLARAWFNLWSFEVGLEDRLRRRAALRRLARPLKRLRNRV